MYFRATDVCTGFNGSPESRSSNLQVKSKIERTRGLLTVHYAPVLAAGLFAPPSDWTFFLAKSESAGGQERRLGASPSILSAH